LVFFSRKTTSNLCFTSFSWRGLANCSPIAARCLLSQKKRGVGGRPLPANSRETVWPRALGALRNPHSLAQAVLSSLLVFTNCRFSTGSQHCLFSAPAGAPPPSPLLWAAGPESGRAGPLSLSDSAAPSPVYPGLSLPRPILFSALQPEEVDHGLLQTTIVKPTSGIYSGTVHLGQKRPSSRGPIRKSSTSHRQKHTPYTQTAPSSSLPLHTRPTAEGMKQGVPRRTWLFSAPRWDVRG
jgi:hypothetical protein